MESFKYDVFISYSRRDTIVVDKICKAFEDNNISYFIDRQGIGGGLEFPKVLAEAILSSQIFLFIASENSYKSKFTQSEVVFAFNKKQKNDIIPYIIDDFPLPSELELTFAAINWRRKSKHPIETTLVDDVLKRVGKTRLVESEDNPDMMQLFKEHRGMIISFFVFVILVCSSLIFRHFSNVKEPIITEPLTTIVSSSVVDSICKNPLLGEFMYTGPIDEDFYPHGKGEAKFHNGDTYLGEFKHGTFEGHATYIYAIGDRFVGTFKDNTLYQGTYTRGNGDYFRGIFKNGQPDLDTGKWYSSQGKEL